jgi:hypothetical protein
MLDRSRDALLRAVSVGPSAPLTRLTWLTTYLLGEQAWVWQTVDLGVCPSCHHGVRHELGARRPKA